MSSSNSLIVHKGLKFANAEMPKCSCKIKNVNCFNACYVAMLLRWLPTIFWEKLFHGRRGRLSLRTVSNFFKNTQLDTPGVEKRPTTIMHRIGLFSKWPY